MYDYNITSVGDRFQTLDEAGYDTRTTSHSQLQVHLGNTRDRCPFDEESFPSTFAVPRYHHCPIQPAVPERDNRFPVHQFYLLGILLQMMHVFTW